MPIVEMPDGRVIEFPDSMSETEINTALGETTAPTKPTPVTSGQDYTRFLGTPQAQVAAGNLREMVREQVPVVGAIAGGAIGSGLGPGFGTLAGAGLGYSIGNLMVRPPSKATEGFQRIPGEVATGMTLEMGGQVLGNLFAKYAIPSAQKFTSTIRGYYEKAIRPPVGVQRTASQADQYFGRVTDAVETIVGNRKNLKLVDDEGNLVAGKLPTSVKEFSQAIDQTKRQVFSEYDALARQAGRQQVQIDLRPIAKDLMGLTSDQVLRTMAPQALDYAGAAAQRLATQGSFTPSQAQEAIGIANQSLRAFYKNPTYETATKAWVDASVAQKLRTTLDTAIESATGAEYQQLKNLYGSLRAIEEDVSKRAAVEARKNVKGFFSLPDIWGGAELARGFLTAEPGSAIAGATAKGLSKYYRWLNSPDRQVDAMFNKASSMMEAMGKTGQRIYSEPVDKSGIVPSPDYKMIGWEGAGRTPTGTEPRSGAPLPITGLGMPDVNVGPPAWQAPQIVTRPGTVPESAKIGEPLIRRGDPTAQAIIPARIGGVQGEIRLSEDGNSIEFVRLNASGESSASMEAIGRLRTEQAGGQTRFRIDTRKPNARIPLTGVDAVDVVPGEWDVIVQKGIGKETYMVLSQGKKVPTQRARILIDKMNAEVPTTMQSIRQAVDAVRKAKGFRPIDQVPIADIADQLGVSAGDIMPIIKRGLASGEIVGSPMSYTMGKASVTQRIKDATLQLKIGPISDITFR